MATTFHEYIDLLSTASLQEYPSNKGSSFTNRLVTPQVLPDHSYVGLEEISYINTFYTISRDNNYLAIYDMLYEHPPNSKENPNDFVTYGSFYFAPLKLGIYKNLQDLCDMVNEALRNSKCPQLQGRTIFTYDPVKLKFTYDITGLWLSLWLYGDLINILGVEKKIASENEYTVIGHDKLKPTYEYITNPPSPPEEPPKNTNSPFRYTEKKKIQSFQISEPEVTIRHFQHPDEVWKSDSKEPKRTFSCVAQLCSVNSFCVFTDIIQSQVTGDVYSDALRFISINSTDQLGASVVTHFSKPFYYKCNKRFIDTISIEIRDIAGRPINFLQGHVRIKLHFIVKPPSLT